VSVSTLLIELAEKMGLLAAAALVAVLFPPLRNRILGVGRRRDELSAVALGLGLSIWGSMLGFTIDDEHMNVRAIGVLIAAILGGWKAGVLAGLGGGLFTAFRTDENAAPWTLIASICDGLIAGLVAERWPRQFQGVRAFVTSCGIQLVHLVLVGIGLVIVGHAHLYIPAWPAHAVKLLVNSAGVTLFVVVARLVVTREENRIALVEARAAADASALEALRRRLEPHFLFNALNTLRATIRVDPTRARELVTDLSDLYRYLLSHPDDSTLREEVTHATAYVAIERARFGDERLKLETDIADELLSHRVPALLLQPLVENAIKHGVAAHSGAGIVRIAARQHAGSLVIEVENASKGAGVDPVDEPGSGTALKTLEERLSKLYGENAGLTLELRGDGAIATVTLPLDARARRAA
jgi:LytS/YehU family sensor histidine kinase